MQATRSTHRTATAFSGVRDFGRHESQRSSIPRTSSREAHLAASSSTSKTGSSCSAGSGCSTPSIGWSSGGGVAVAVIAGGTTDGAGGASVGAEGGASSGGGVYGFFRSLVPRSTSLTISSIAQIRTRPRRTSVLLMSKGQRGLRKGMEPKDAPALWTVGPFIRALLCREFEGRKVFL